MRSTATEYRFRLGAPPEELPQAVLETHLSRGPPGRFKPGYEILHPHPMANYRLLYRNLDCSQASSDVAGPFRIPECTKSLGHSLVERLRRDFDAVLNAA